MKNIDVFYFDIDGTILNNEDQSISNTTITSLLKLKELNYKVIMSTGRTLKTVSNSEFKDIIKWDGYILGNGGVIIDNNNEIIRDVFCDFDFVNDLINLYPKTIILEGNENFIINKPSKSILNFLKNSKVEIKNNIYNNEKVHKIIIEDINLIKDGFNNPIFDNYTYHLNAEDMYEIFPKGSGKEVAIKLLNKHLNVASFVYFGDGNNDIGAIKMATIGIAMGNANDKVKEAADYITSHINNNGIYNALKHFKFI